MTISRNEFKELVELYKDTQTKSNEYAKYFNEELTYEIMFSVLHWIEEKLGISEDDFDLLFELTCFSKCVPISWKMEQVGEDEYEARDIEYSDDLDKIYDKYLNKENDK